MPDVKEVINGLEMSYKYSNVDENNTLVPQWIVLHAIALLKAQEQATIEPKRIELADETKAWLDKMDAVDALENISSICLDWDGYRTANGLGGLINEIWAYARYCADRLLKAQEPRVMTLVEVTEDRPDVVWFDDRHYKLTYPAFVSNGEVTGWVVSLSQGCLERHDHIDGYGKGWRCWTSRPTDEQREATPWIS